MNYLKHNLQNISNIIVDAITTGNVNDYDHIHIIQNICDGVAITQYGAKHDIVSTIYKKEDVGVYTLEDWDWFGSEDDEYYDAYTFLGTTGIPEKDLQTIEQTVKQILYTRK